MPRPPVELRRMEDEERRRALAHRRLRREARRLTVLWCSAALLVLAILAFLLRLSLVQGF